MSLALKRLLLAVTLAVSASVLLFSSGSWAKRSYSRTPFKQRDRNGRFCEIRREIQV